MGYRSVRDPFYLLTFHHIEGAEMLEEILSCPAKTAQFVMVCSRLASHYRFDGWLLNIENKVDPALVPSLKDLVDQLTIAVKKEVEDGLVLWYDSVTVEVMWAVGYDSVIVMIIMIKR